MGAPATTSGATATVPPPNPPTERPNLMALPTLTLDKTEADIWNSGAVWVYGYAGVTTVDLSLTWMTTAAWPSSLPGTAA